MGRSTVNPFIRDSRLLLAVPVWSVPFVICVGVIGDFKWNSLEHPVSVHKKEVNVYIELFLPETTYHTFTYHLSDDDLSFFHLWLSTAR